MKILVLNPNTDRAMTEALAAQAKRVAPPDAEIVAATVPFGPSLISRRRDIAIGAAAVLAAVSAHGSEVEAVVIGSFSDPGLEAAREVATVPVVGLCEAGVLSAMQLGARIGLLLGAARMIPVLEERLRAWGIRERVTAIRTPPDGVRPVDVPEVISMFSALATELVERDGVEVIVLGGGKLIGLAPTLNRTLAVPVLDSVDCAVLHAYCLVRLGARKPTVGSYSRPPAVQSSGLDDRLRGLYEPGA